LRRLQPDGKVALTATRLETLEKARRILLDENWLTEIVHLQVSRAQPLSGGSYMQALNPVWLITGSAKAG
jgi:precorrin-6B methylase 2